MPARRRARSWADVGKNRLGRFRRAAVVEQLQGAAWVPIARFGSIASADAAVDEMVARGSEPDHLRVTEMGPKTAPWIAALAGAIVVVLIVWLVLVLAT